MAAEGAKLGLATAVRELQRLQADQARLADGSIAPHQLPLLPLSEEIEGDEAGENQATVTRGAGRPPGARNLSTEAWRDMYLRNFRSPLWVLGSAYSRPTQVLAHELGLKLGEAYKLQQDAAIAALPYIHQKQPTAIDLGDAKIVQLVIHTGSPADPRSGAIDGEAFEAEILPLEAAETIEQNQQLGSNDRPDLDNPDLDNSGQAIDASGESAIRAPDQRSDGEER